MWIRADLKERAKNVLRKYYWIAFLVTLVASILGGMQGPQVSYRLGANDFHAGGFNWNWNDYANGSPDAVSAIMAILFGTLALSGIFFVVLAFAYAFRIFVGCPIETGMDYYFLEARQDRSDFVNLFHAFRGGRYLNVVKAMAWRELFTFLWTLLFIIPGIVKGYAYAMIPYIMAENPQMDYQRAMKLSMAMTNGQKGEMFVLDLSFLGWYLLGLLACCVGVIFVAPYYYATKAELYIELKHRAIVAGICTEEDFGGKSAVVV